MTALYRGDRQAEALSVYQQLRRTLGEELGLEPSASLRRLETAILRQDPQLEWSGAAAAPEVTGGVTVFLFTDLERSTELLTRLGDDPAEELRRIHFALLRQAVAETGGCEVKSLGDGLMVSFSSPLAALRCAIGMQQAIAEHNANNSDERLELRIGLHAGEPFRTEDDFFGTSVVVARRLCDHAEGGQILASELLVGLVGSRGGFRFGPVSRLTLKGLPDPVPAMTVEWRFEAALQAPAPDEPVPAVPMPRLLAGTSRIFVGRDAELARLRGLWSEVVVGNPRVVFIGGEPGVGKTRLAGEFSSRAHDEGATVLAGHCDESLGVPYQPFVEALRHFIEHTPRPGLPGRLGRHPEELSRLIPELAEQMPGMAPPVRADPETERYRLFEAVASWLGVAAQNQPVLFVLDDLQWAAKPTLLMLRHVVGAIESSAVLILATYRDVDLTRSHPLVELFADVHRQGLDERLHVAGLSPTEVAALLEARAGHELDDAGRALADAVAGETGGNAFFVVEVLRHLAETGRLVERDGRWTMESVALADLDIPAGLRDVIDRRLNLLSEEANLALVNAAVLGGKYDFEVLARMTGLERQMAIDAVEEAVRARLLTEVPDRPVPTYAFAHDLVRERLLDELSRPRAELLHLAAAEAIEATATATSTAAMLAMHYRSAGALAPPDKSIEATLAAGQEAARALAWEEVAAHWETALAVMEATGAAPLQRAELLRRMADLMHITGFDAARQIEYSEKALALYEEYGRNDRAAEMHSRLGAYLATFYDTMDIPRARRHFELARSALEGSSESAVLGYVFVGLAATELWSGSPHPVFQLLDEALGIAQRLGLPILEAQAKTLRAWQLFDVGSLDEGLEEVERGWEMADRLEHRFVAFVASWIRCQHTSWAVLDPVDGVTWLERELDRPRLAQAPVQRRVLFAQLAWMRIHSGHVAQARRLLTEAPGLPIGWAYTPPIELWEGDWDSAKSRLERDRDRAQAAGTSHDEWACRFYLGEVARLRERYDEAAVMFGQALTLAVDARTVPLEIWVRLALAAVDVRRRGLDEARQHVVRARTLMDGQDWRGLAGRLEVAEAALLTADGQLDEARAKLRDARDVFRRYRLPWEEAEALWWTGSVEVQAAGNPGEAERAFTEAAEIYRRCGAGQLWLDRVAPDVLHQLAPPRDQVG
jgi:class 3 adenylate cyclase/tetratricopeptide (TPR) repeat protein